MKRIINVAFTVIIIAMAFSACEKGADTVVSSNGKVSPFASFRDIPEVTDEEITAIEALQKDNRIFEYGVLPTLEFFTKENGEDGGYTALLCQWLTELFGIRFQPRIYQLNELLEKLGSHEVDFAGSLSSAGGLKNTYMTDPIATRKGVMVRIKGSPSITQISQTRLPRYTFLRGMAAQRYTTEAFEPGSYEAASVENHLEAYKAIKNGDADAYIAQNVTEEFFSSYDDVSIEDFFPLVFTPVHIITANSELKPVISIITKALQNGADPYLNDLYNRGYEEYKKSKVFQMLNEEERAYLQNPSPVLLAVQYYNYPISFYNRYEKKWEGGAFDILSEIEKLTGLTFQVVNDEFTNLTDLLEMLQNGSAHIMPDLIFSKEREGSYIWTENEITTDQYALLSKTSYPNVSVNEIASERVGLIKSTVHAELFRAWFPNAVNSTEYNTADAAFHALDKNEVDLVMANKSHLLSVLNYYEFSDYKANYLFNHSYNSTFGFNKDQTILCSIVDKALPFVDTYMITEQWMTKTYNYRGKVAEAQRPWLIGATVLISVILALILFMFYRSRGEEKRLEKLVAKETSTLTSIINATQDIIFCKDLDSRYIRCNKSMQNHFNLADSDIIGKNDLDALGVPPEMAARFVAEDQSVINEGKTVILEEMIPSADGRLLLFETIKTPIIQDGKATGLVGMSRDITRRKAMEEEARSANAAKSRFIANMSHEMRTPMNVIVGLTDLMLEESDIPGKIKEDLRKVNTAGNTLMELINDVLDISKIEADKLELMPVQYDVASNINDIITLNMIRIEEKPITFELNINEYLPCSLFGDDLRVKQIMNNLLSNAFKYTQKGTITWGIDSHRENLLPQGSSPLSGNDNVWIDFYIKDTGIGIREEDLEKLFSEYNQVDTHANRVIEGTGLGLSITKKLVELMDGEITVESEYGKGTTFHVRIRQGFVTDTTIGKATVENLCSFRYSDKKKLIHEKLVRPNLSYAKVLLVDDLPTNLDVAAGMLRKYKMQVDCVTSGQDAVDRISAGDPVYDAIFMDHMMPGMDGVEATMLIRALGTKYAESIPVIALTANAVAGNEQMFLSKGFNAFLPKPFNVKSLDSIIQKWVRDKSKEEKPD
ncbi:MAG: ATP-binding protein [Treponema sp.]|nr:ATP-binding protein [Treponema sp.]